MSAWPKERELEFIALRQAGTPVKEIAAMANVSEQVASYHLIDVEPITKALDILPYYPDETLRIPEGDCAWTSDWHSPYLDMQMARRLLAVCAALDIRRLAIVGDFADMAWISKYVRQEHRGSLANDMDITMSVLFMLLNFFEEVWWCGGNHDSRLAAALKGEDLLGTLAKWAGKSAAGKLYYSDQRTLLFSGHWRLEHPKVYSKDAAKIAAAACSIYLCNVACAHGHRIGFKYDASGKYVGLDLGGMFDINKQEYMFKTGMLLLPAVNPGFWVYKAGKVVPFADAFTNWADYGAD